MKKITLSLIAVALTCLTANAQFKKSWDFTNGLSDETIANLKADGSHWAENGNDADGNVNNWKNVGKPATDSYLMANGQVIDNMQVSPRAGKVYLNVAHLPHGFYIARATNANGTTVSCKFER